MHALLHTICAVVVVPYIALALFFFFVGQAASSKGMLALIEAVWSNFYFYWYLYALSLFVGLAASFVWPTTGLNGAARILLVA